MLYITNAKIFTGDRTFPWAESLLIKNGIVQWVGKGIAPEPAPTYVLDLGGRLVLPGLVDAHTHFLKYAMGLENVRMVGVQNLKSALNMVAQRVQEVQPKAWVVGDSYNHNVWGMDREPNRYDLDAVSPNNPVIIYSKCVHTAWVNSRALELAGITAETPDPPGSRIERDEKGQPLGLLREGAMDLVSSILPPSDEAKVLRLLKKAIGQAHAMGLTGIHNFEGREALKHFTALAKEASLNFRAIMNIPVANIAEAINLGLTSGFGDEWVRIGGIKSFADGALGSQTGLMFEPHEGSEDRGIQTMSTEQLREAITQGALNGLASAVHAIGDRANHLVLNLFEDVAKLGIKGLRQRIEHAQVMRPEDIERCGRLGVVASVQPTHVLGDMDIIDKYWGTRGRFAYAFRSLADAGSVLAFGSDSPVESLDPILGIHAAVNRQRPDGHPQGGYYPQEKISVGDAVRAYTWGSAYAAHQEKWVGTLKVGKLGDFIVLDQDIFTIDPKNIWQTKVDMTIVGGSLVYERDCLKL